QVALSISTCQPHAYSSLEFYPLSLHDALPIWIDGKCQIQQQRRPQEDDGQSPRNGGTAARRGSPRRRAPPPLFGPDFVECPQQRDRKSTRLNSSHQIISYAVFCLKKKT